MFIMHISAIMAYLGMIAGTALFILSVRNPGEGSSLGKFIGCLVLILSLLNAICIGFYGAKYWAQGAYESPMSMSMQMHKDMMEKMMPQMMGQMEHGGMMGKDQMGKMDMEKGDDQYPAKN